MCCAYSECLVRFVGLLPSHHVNDMNFSSGVKCGHAANPLRMSVVPLDCCRNRRAGEIFCLVPQTIPTLSRHRWRRLNEGSGVMDPTETSTARNTDLPFRRRTAA